MLPAAVLVAVGQLAVVAHQHSDVAAAGGDDLGVDRAAFEQEQGLVAVAPLVADDDAVGGEPGADAGGGMLDAARGGSDGRARSRGRSELLEQFARHDGDVGRYIDQLGAAVRPVIETGNTAEILALAGHGPHNLDDPRRVVHRTVDRNRRVIEALGQGIEHPAHQAVVVHGQIHAVQEVVPVARQDGDRCGPAQGVQVRVHRPGPFRGRGELSVGGADPRRPDGIDIDQQPAAPHDVTVLGGCAGPEADPIRRPRQQRRRDRVHRHVYRRRERCPIQFDDRLRGGVDVFNREAPRAHVRPPSIRPVAAIGSAHLEYVPGLKEQTEEFADCRLRSC